MVTEDTRYTQHHRDSLCILTLASGKMVQFSPKSFSAGTPRALPFGQWTRMIDISLR